MFFAPIKIKKYIKEKFINKLNSGYHEYYRKFL